jgi:arabinose-5-phosphate isomerase
MVINLLKSEAVAREAWLASAARAVKTQGDGLLQLAAALDGDLGAGLCNAVDLIRRSRGRLILSGIGKSGHVGRKIAATLASTGTPAMFVHPSEASHGDLGMITRDDVIMMLSNSGESAELKDMLDYAKRFGVKLIAMTARPDSTLAKEADIVLLLPRAQEACPIGLAPTTSTLLQMALGDALAVTLLEEKGFSARDFKMFHPGGKLGAALKHVGDIMHLASELPLAHADQPMADALLIMTAKSFGCLGAIDDDGRLVGIVTDGD